MKLKDALVGLMFWLLALVIVFSVSIEDGPTWAVVVISIIVWIAYTLVIIRDYRAEKNRPRPVFWLEMDGEWRAIDSDGQLIPREKMPPKPIEEPNIYDQEEDER